MNKQLEWTKNKRGEEAMANGFSFKIRSAVEDGRDSFYALIYAGETQLSVTGGELRWTLAGAKSICQSHADAVADAVERAVEEYKNEAEGQRRRDECIGRNS
jgi:hypothetical protein